MTQKEFARRVRFNGGYDEVLGQWKLLAVHQVPEVFEERHEVDFYCSDGQSVYLLRIRKRATEKYVRLPTRELTYLVAELPFAILDAATLQKALATFKRLARG